MSPSLCPYFLAKRHKTEYDGPHREVKWRKRGVAMNFSKWVFRLAGIYGLLVIVPQFFMEPLLVAESGPLIHPEHFYGFLCVTTAWQVLFLMIAQDPVRYRLLMIPSILEKVPFSVAIALLYAQGRVPSLALVFGAIDVVLAGLFLGAFVKLGRLER
jgi:hypothetical protein